MKTARKAKYIEDDDEKSLNSQFTFYFRNYCVYGYLLCEYTNDYHKNSGEREMNIFFFYKNFNDSEKSGEIFLK